MPLILRLALLAVLAPLHAAAQQALEVIPLRHRTVEQVLPVLRPLLEPGGALTGQRGQLIVRTSPENLAELRRALAAIDQPARRLLISVRLDEVSQSTTRGVQGDARVGNRGARIDIRAQDDSSSRAERVDQRVQVLEGGRALIMAGRTVPLPGGTWETATGFEAIPRLAGDTVFVDIAPQRESLERQERIATTLSARLGEWFEVGGALHASDRDERGAISRSRTGAYETRRVWLKVEALP